MNLNKTCKNIKKEDEDYELCKRWKQRVKSIIMYCVDERIEYSNREYYKEALDECKEKYSEEYKVPIDIIKKAYW